MKALCILVISALAISGCQTTYNADRPKAVEGQAEDSIVFVRPDRYSIIGTRSIRNYVEVVYEQSNHNEADLLRVSAGFRNKGGQQIYDFKGPDFVISVKTTFFNEPIQATGPQGPPVYETNWQTLSMNRGAISHYEAICPVPEGLYYQIVVSEQLAR